MSGVSLDTAGLSNYSVKRDWRRVKDGDQVREGYDYFWANVTDDYAVDPLNQPFPNNVTLLDTDTSKDLYIHQITRSGNIATVTFRDYTDTGSPDFLAIPKAHDFIVGETILVAGATQSEYNGSFTVTAITRKTLQYVVSGTPASPATGSITLRSNENINLVAKGKRPNGKTAVVVGTKTRLFRFYSLENGAYYEGNGTANEYFENSGTDNEYFLSNYGDWVQIASGFATNGRRWQAESVNGWLVVNNEVDLPWSYRVEDIEAFPVYELREQGVAAVGCISELGGIFHAGDVIEIDELELENVFLPQGIVDSGTIAASQSSTSLTTNTDFFAATDVGKYIVYDDDDINDVRITAFTNAKSVTVTAGPPVSLSQFKTRVKASQAGSTFSEETTGAISSGDTEVQLSGGTFVFAAGDVGKKLRFVNGWESTIVTFNSTTSVELADAAPSSFGYPFWLIDSDANKIVAENNTSVFTDEMVGCQMVWDTGEVRTITGYINAYTVYVNDDYSIPVGYISIENKNTYKAYTDYSKTSRVQFRHIWSDIDYPTRWASSFKGSMGTGDFMVVLDNPISSIEVDRNYTILGAGLNGGNLSANVIQNYGGKVIVLDQRAETSVTSVDISATDTIGSIIGFEDLQDDGSAIINMRPLNNTMVIYKGTSVVLADYTGIALTPFSYTIRRIKDGEGLYYKHTLEHLGSDKHIYAGRDAFYIFDLTRRVPQMFELLKLCDNVIFDEVDITETDQVYAVNNVLTKEVWFVFPSSTSDHALIWDYRYGHASTTSINVDAAATVERPEEGNITGTSEDWFVMAAGQVVLLYGKTNASVSSWGDNEIFYRRDALPFAADMSPYMAELRSGMGAFGAPYIEKFLNNEVLYFHSDTEQQDLTYNLYGTRNTPETPTLLATKTQTALKSFNAIPMHFLQNYYQDQILVDVLNNKVVLVGRTWEVGAVDSRSTIRNL